MNRQLKFRVWDKITNQYLQELGIYYWHIPYSLDGEKITGEANLVGLSELLRHDNFVVQQYTGLNDKNKKEEKEEGGEFVFFGIDVRTLNQKTRQGKKRTLDQLKEVAQFKSQGHPVE